MKFVHNLWVRGNHHDGVLRSTGESPVGDKKRSSIVLSNWARPHEGFSAAGIILDELSALHPFPPKRLVEGFRSTKRVCSLNFDLKSCSNLGNTCKTFDFVSSHISPLVLILCLFLNHSLLLGPDP